jgi:thioredoxin-related protein
MKKNVSVTFLMIGVISLWAFKSDNQLDIQVRAKNEHKNIVVYFCGSDWCSICTKFKKSFLTQSPVDSLLNNGFVYYTADFPQRTKLSPSVTEFNETLAEKLNPEGEFPLLVIADENLIVKEKIYATTPEVEALRKINSNKK